MSAAPLTATRPAEAPLVGIALRLTAVASLAALAAAIKLVADLGVATLDLVFYRTLFSLPVLFVWLAIGPGFASVKTRRPKAHALRSLLGVVGMTLNFTAIALLPLAEATAIGFTAPLFATAASALLLGESVGKMRWAALAIGFAGVLVVVRPGGGALDGAAVAIALVAAMMTAAVALTMRQMGATEPAATTVFWFTMIALAVTGTAMLGFGTTPPRAAWPLLIAIGLFGGLTQITLTASLRFAPIATVAPFDFSQLVWTALLGWWLFATPPAAATLLGGAIIAASGVFVLWRERRTRPVTPAAGLEPDV